MLAFFNSNVFQLFADIICQGLHYSTGHIPRIPYIEPDEQITIQINELSCENYKLSKSEWNDDEISWDFKKHPLL